MARKKSHAGVTSEGASGMAEMPLETGPVKRLVMPVAGYTRFVLFGRSFLWVLIAAILGVVIWIAADNTRDEGARIVFSSSVAPGEADQNVMVNPHYQGVDAHNQPYTVVAETATQKDEDTVILQKLTADILQRDGTWLALKSGSGELNTKTRKLKLEEGVSLFYEDGYEFRSDYAFVDIREGTAYGKSPVEAQGPSGTLKANSFSIEKRGEIMRFNGSVRMTLYP